MTELLHFLDSTGWEKTRAETRRKEINGALYEWVTGDAWASLLKWNARGSTNETVKTFRAAEQNLAIALSEKLDGQNSN